MSRVSFPAFSILCRDALILGILGDLLKGPILSNSPFMGSDSEAPGWGVRGLGLPSQRGAPMESRCSPGTDVVPLQGAGAAAESPCSTF